jgi:hypothetical protein
MSECKNKNCTKRGCKRVDFARLLGFETISDQIAGSLDFQDQTFGDALGAKIGTEDTSIALFQEETVAAKLGAKVGDPEEAAPNKGIDGRQS